MAKSKAVRSHKGLPEKLQALAREKYGNLTAGEAVKKAGVSNATYHRWKNALWAQVEESHLNGTPAAAAEAAPTTKGKGKGKTTKAGPATKRALTAVATSSVKPEMSLKDRVAQLEAENLQLRLTIADMALEARHAPH